MRVLLKVDWIAAIAGVAKGTSGSSERRLWEVWTSIVLVSWMSFCTSMSWVSSGIGINHYLI